MEAAKHTPGEWSLADENNQCCSVLLGTEHNLTCSLDRQDGNTGALVIERDELLANARLIAAAPDLLAALHDAQQAIHELRTNGAPRALWHVIEDANNAAIAKATGAA